MKLRPWTLIPFALVVAAGCNSESSTPKDGDAKASADTSATSPASAPASSPASAPASAPATEPSTPPSSPSSAPAPTDTPSVAPGSPATAPPAKPVDVPKPAAKTITNEGLEYAGVKHSKPIDMELVMSSEPGKVTTGSQTVTLKESKPDKLVYSVDRSGGLAALGTEEWTVTPKGVFTTKSSMMTLGDDAMELPASPKPGMTWKFHTKSDQANASMDMEISCKILGQEDFKTKGGSYKNALVVEQDGVGTVKDQKVRTESKNWYVKGLGLVKATLKNHLPNGKIESLSIQETMSQ